MPKPAELTSPPLAGATLPPPALPPAAGGVWVRARDSRSRPDACVTGAAPAVGVTISAAPLAPATRRVNGDTAVSETTANTSMMQALDEKAVQGVLVRAKGVSVTLIRGRYADKWSTRNGRWALDHRRYIEDFRTVEEFPTPARASAGRRDRTDPSYEVYGF